MPMQATVYLVGPWAGDGPLEADLRTAIARIGGALCPSAEGATGIVRVRRVGPERWVEADPALVRALLHRPAVCAFELGVDSRAGRAVLHRVRLDANSEVDVLARGSGEGIPLPDGIDPDDLADLACDLALVRLAADGGTVAPGSTNATHRFYRCPGPSGPA
ncbi:MAG: hypothetical protein ABMB14_12185 [Myxococcota bacterium]